MSANAAKKQRVASVGARRRKRLFLTLVCLFSGWVALALWEQNDALNDKKHELRQLQIKLDEVRSEHEAYQLEVTRLQDPEYIEQRVRKDYGMARPGDKVFADPTN